MCLLTVLAIRSNPMLALECFKDVLLLSQGHFNAGYLPLHLCSLGVFLFLLIAISRTAKWKGVFGEIAVTLILPGWTVIRFEPPPVHSTVKERSEVTAERSISSMTTPS